MPGIRARLQEFFGEKFFRDKVTFDKDVTFLKDVVFKRTVTAYSPVPSEPSLGTPHPVTTWLTAINIGVTAAGWTGATALPAGLPAGHKGVQIAMEMKAPQAGTYALISRQNVADTAGLNCYVYSQVAAVLQSGGGPVRVASGESLYVHIGGVAGGITLLTAYIVGYYI